MMFKLDKTSTKPMYKQIIDSITEKIISGELKHMDILPSEETSQEIYGISSIVIKKSYDTLSKIGYITRKRGKGTFVNYPPSFTIDLLNAHNPYVHYKDLIEINIILFDTLQTDQKNINTLKVSGKYQGFILFIQDISWQETSQFNFEISNLIKLYDDLSRYKLSMHHDISPKLSNHIESFLFNIDTGSPLIKVSSSNESKTFVVSTIYRSDFVEMQATTYE